MFREIPEIVLVISAVTGWRVHVPWVGNRFDGPDMVLAKRAFVQKTDPALLDNDLNTRFRRHESCHFSIGDEIV